MEDFQDLLKALEIVKAGQKALAEKESRYKERLMELLKENGLKLKTWQFNFFFFASRDSLDKT